jgi:CDP-glucose 4,6-dehydratase
MNSQFWKGKTVLLTGHTGFKGSWLSLWLQKIGANVIGFSKSVPTKPSLFYLANVKDDMTSIMGDTRNFNKIEKVINEFKPQIIFHMAAQSLVHTSYQKPSETFSTNIMGTVNLFESIRISGIPRVVVNVTSDKCYENKELKRGYREDDIMGGYDPYSSSKGCAELITSSFRDSFFNTKNYKKHQIALASVRAGNVLGGGDWSENRLIPDIIRSITNNLPVEIRNSSATRPWQFVLEPLSGYLLLAEKLWKYGPKYAEGWNFGPNNKDIKPVSYITKKFMQLWKDDINFKSNKKINLHETNYLKLDCTKAKTKLGWEPKMNLDLALEYTVEWYEKFIQKENIREFSEQQIENFGRL